MKNKQNEKPQQLLSDVLSNDNYSFNKELCIAMLSAGIPLTSVDVERSFSTYKNILLDNRRSLVFENIEHYIIVQCNAQNLVSTKDLLRMLILHTF